MTEKIKYESGREQTVMLAIEHDRRMAWMYVKGIVHGFLFTIAGVTGGVAGALIALLF